MKKCTAILLTLLTLLIGVFSTLLPTTLQASADTTVYTDVLDDLEKDSTFNLQDYPVIADDYSLQIIQVAESTTGELLLYVYQPSNGTLEKDLQASYINLAVDTSGLDFNRYSLSLLDTTSTFSKYKVNGFTVSTDTYRYYTISTIYRPWISGVDENPPVGTTISDIDYSVGITWKVYYYNNVLTYESKYVETVDITVTYSDFIRYPDGFKLAPISCDSHYVAFSTDRDISRLIDAEVVYDSREAEKTIVPVTGVSISYSNEKKDLKVTVSEKEEVEFIPSGWFVDDIIYDWQRIETAEYFLNNVGDDIVLTDEVKNTFTEYGFQWVLRFLETDYVSSPLANNYQKYTEVTNVSILRLSFVEDGRVYNLGAVGSVVSGDEVPGNDVAATIGKRIEQKLNDLWEKILQLIAIVFLIWIVVKILMSVCGALIKIILGWIWELLKFVITWTFRIVFFPLWLLFGGLKKKK